MKKRVLAVMIGIAMISTLLVGCGKHEEQIEPIDPEPIEEELVEEEPIEVPEATVAPTAEPTKEAEPEEVAPASTGAVDFTEAKSAMKEEMDAETINVLYASSAPIDTPIDSTLTLTLDGYEMLEVLDFHQDVSIPFDDHADRGGVLLAKFTIKNSGTASAFYPLPPGYTFTGATQAYSSNTHNLLPEEMADFGKILRDANTEVKPGEEVSGYMATAFAPDALDAVMGLGVLTMEVESGYTEADAFDFDKKIGDEQNVDLPLSSDGADAIVASGAFLQDSLSTDNMGTKTMDMEKTGIGETQEIGGVKITLDAYQFVIFEPNEVEAPRFENFENGIVVLTAKFLMDNQDTVAVDLSSLLTTLNMNNDGMWTTSEGMLTDYDSNSAIQPGTQGENLQVFVLDKEQYDKIWKDKEFSIEMDLRDTDMKDIGKGKEVTFVLPK